MVTVKQLEAFGEGWNRHDVDYLMTFMADDCAFETTAGKEVLTNAQPAWLAAQARAKALLGNDGMTAVINTADRILNASKISIPDAGIEDEDNDAEHERSCA